MKHIECQQGSIEWWAARRGVPTASGFDRIITPKTMKLAAAHVEYACELIGDMHRLDDADARDGYTSPAMQNGIDTEPEARAWYEMENSVTVERVGFITTDDGRFGCSPDALVGDMGGLELKCPRQKAQVRYLLGGRVVPDEYKAQVHGNLIVTGRAWWDFLSYCPGLPTLIVRVEPDKFTAALKSVLEEFWGSYTEMLAKVKAFEEPQQTLIETLSAAVAAEV
jgi:hypothetical protein